MIWTILQTIGSLLSGISILTAFILYRIEQNDKYNKDIRKAIADTVTTIEEQYSLLKSNFIFSYVEEFFSNRYFRQYLSDLGAYIESHIDKKPDEIKKFCHKSNRWSPMLDSPILHQNTIQEQYHINDAKITKSLTYDLADIKGLARMLDLFQEESRRLEQTIAEDIIGSDFGIDAICDVLIENRVDINNENILRRKLIQKYIQCTEDKNKKQIEKLSAMYEVIKIILKRLFSFEDKALRKYASSCRRQTPVPHNKTVQDEYTAIIKALPDRLFSDCKTECSRKIGSIDAISTPT